VTLKMFVVTNGKEVKAVIDTGAEVMVMSETAF
jgi:predicted aspartyl protease